MATIKVSIQDENTLVIQEPAEKGDLIDLQSIHETDIDKTTIQGVVNSIKKDAFEQALDEKIKAFEEKSKLLAQIKERELADKASESLQDRDLRITELQNQLNIADKDRELAVTKAVGQVEQERDELKIKLSSEVLDKERIETALTKEIERVTNLKAKLSVKMVGENLEQHCQIEFNGIRSSMFPFSYFEKDNQAVEGTKGDYIYRDYESKDGIEIISIMFEMKDEQEDSVNKQSIESHLRKLDEDRRKKDCEYAILVTLLEADSDLYNRGIVDVSHKYEKMFVIRPQFFLPLISLLKNASLKSAEDKRQLVEAKNSNIDIENFVDNMETWKSGWSTTMKNVGKKHFEAIDQIKKAIKDLEKVRDALEMSDKHLLAAENKMEDLTVRRITKNAPSVAERFREQGKL